ncbi:hypothetical protein UPYG_G00106410 [Umbra pygmaea]|uniref:PH domain-containing protein n=1 Tax=Umbra pygmaea TaxID=75934 RepID=A0ABD0X209_UMBPY
MDQAKPIYGGWLCLAPEGTDFNNPMQRSRKWQRRFFILYDNGSLSFALDELTSTLPQGTVNMNGCTEMVDAEPRTGQRNTLCIVTPDQEVFIRGENKEIINGWSEQLIVFPRNKHNQKKKRKVESTSQEPSPAKMAATEPSFSLMESGDPQSSFCQEEPPTGGPDVDPVWPVTDTDPLGLDKTPAGHDPQYLPLTYDSGRQLSSSTSIRDYVASKGTGSAYLATEPNPIRSHPTANNRNPNTATSHYREPERPIGGVPVSAGSNEDLQAGSRTGRSKARINQREKLQSCGELGPGQLTAPVPERRSKSLDRRTSESAMTPDLLNFKKGWMMKMDKEDEWRKYWFVLSADSLRYYKDSLAEENSDLNGEIDLSKCHNVSEYQVQRNYGFQIHTQKCVYTLSAMTAGIRRNWIKALMKNVHPSSAPDVASSLPAHHIPCCPPDNLPLPKPDVTQESSLSAEVPSERAQGPKQNRIYEKRREGRSKTFDWTELRPMLATEQGVGPEVMQPPLMELGDLERKRRREERRRRYECVLGFPPAWETERGGGDVGPSLTRTQQREIDECWQQVERSVCSPERSVSLNKESQCKDREDIEMLLQTFNRKVEELEGQLAVSELSRFELEAQLATARGYQEPFSDPLEAPSSPELGLPSLEILTVSYLETRELLLQQKLKRRSMQEQLLQHGLENHSSPGSHQSPPTSIWLHDTEGNLLDQLIHGIPTPSDMDLSSDSAPNSGHENIGPNRSSEASSQQYETVCPESHPTSIACCPDSLSRGETHSKANSMRIDLPARCETPRTTDEYADPDQAIVLRRLAQEVELLSNQNKALNQRNQEMLNQLTEADREIERLKARLSSKYSGSDFHPKAEQHSQAKVEGLEGELCRRDQQLQEAQCLVDSLDQRLRDTELQLREATLKALGFPAAQEAEEDDEGDDEVKEEEAEEEIINAGHLEEKERERLKMCLQDMEAKQLELEKQLLHTEQTCRELQACNTELTEVGRLYSIRAREAEADVMRLSEEVETIRMLSKEQGLRCWSEGKWQDEIVLLSGNEKIQQVAEGIMAMSRTLGRVLQVIDRSDMNVVKALLDNEHVEVNQTVVTQVQLEEAFWDGLLKGLKANPSQSAEEKLTDIVLCQSLESMVVQNQMLHLAYSLFSQGNVEALSLGRINACRSLRGLHIIGDITGETVSETEEGDEERILNVHNTQKDAENVFSQHFTEITQERMFLLDQIASSVRASANNDLQSLAERLCHYHRVSGPWLASIHCTAMEAFSSYRISRLNSLHKRKCQGTQQKLIIASSSPLLCSSCAGRLSATLGLNKECIDLPKTELLDNTEQQATGSPDLAGGDVGRVRTYAEVVEGGSLTNLMERPVVMVGAGLGDVLTNIQDFESGDNAEWGSTSEAHEGRRDSLGEEELKDGLSSLKDRVKELEEQLSVTTEDIKAEHDGIIASLRLKHEEDVNKLKEFYERGFDSIEECHQKVLRELQLRHQEEVQRLQRDTDRLLDEETAATVTAIEALKNAHRAELEREIQRAFQTNNIAGDKDIGTICRQHSEELASCHRELEVLSQQYCLKCLECSQLAQALEAERQALGQCQQENTDLRSRNQDLSGNLAAEISRLCSVAKQEAVHFHQERDVYELEITLRVKESEVQCLRHEIISLKDEIQTAHRDNRYISEKYKDISTELGVLRAKAVVDVGQLRENLMLAHKALEELSSAVDSDSEYQRTEC